MKVLIALAALLLPLLLAAAGYLAGPALARLNYTVELAHELAVAPDSAQLASTEPRQMALNAEAVDRARAFQTAGGSLPELNAAAANIVRNFRIGGALLGAWCGLVAALRLLAMRRRVRRLEHDIDHALCVACGRCFLSCPREHVRLKNRAAAPVPRAPQGAPAGE